MTPKKPRYRIAKLDELPPTPCPCGEARRAFRDLPEAPASAHLTEIRGEPKAHYHKRTTEIYIALDGEGQIELDGERRPFPPLTAVMILPGCPEHSHPALRSERRIFRLSRSAPGALCLQARSHG